MENDPIEAFQPIGQPPNEIRVWNLRHKTITDGARLSNVIQRFRDSPIKGPYLIDLSYNRLTVQGVLQLVPLLKEYPMLKLDLGCNHFYFPELNPILEEQGCTTLLEEGRIRMEHQTEDLLKKAAEDIAASAATMKTLVGHQKNSAFAIEEELRKAVANLLGPDSNTSTRWFYQPIQGNKVWSLFDIDGLVEGQLDGKDVLVFISAKSYVEGEDVTTLGKHIQEVNKYLTLLGNGGGWGKGTSSKKLQDQDWFFSRFLEYTIQGAIGGPLWAEGAKEAARKAGFWRITTSGHGYQVDI